MTGSAPEAADLRLLRWGEGSRRILLLHGVGSNADGWWRLGAALTGAGWEVVAPDLRGHGGSPKPGDHSLAAYAGDVLALEGPWDAVLGHSMGGAVATLASVSDPGWASTLILQDPALLMPESMRQVKDWLLDDFSRPLTPARVSADNPRWHPRDAEIKARALQQVGPEVVERIIDANWPWMLLDEAASLSVPTLVVGSDPESGGLLPVAVGRWLEETNPLIEYVVIPGSSHSVHRDADLFDSYLATVIDGLQRLPTLG